MVAIWIRFGGDLNVQAAFYVMGIMIISAAAMGIMNRKRTRRHRKWMLRTLFCLNKVATL